MERDYRTIIADEIIVGSKEFWLSWFEANGNHGSDGWSNANDWFEDMVRTGLLR